MKQEAREFESRYENKYQPRYLAWCFHTGRNPELRFGGENNGYAFMSWIGKFAREFKYMTGSETIIDHEAFTAYLWQEGHKQPV